MRGDATRVSVLRKGRIEMPVGGLSAVVTLLGVVYGLCMGSSAAIRTATSADCLTQDALLQVIASALKLPLLFFLALLVTFPSLYVFNALVGSRLSMVSAARLLVAMLGVTLAVLASLGPIVVFFAVNTSSYPFMKLLNVAMASIAGALGLAFLLRTMRRLVMMQDQMDFPSPAPSAPDGDQALEDPDGTDTRSALDRIDWTTSRKATAVFKIWVVVFALVGAQMSWVLRRFIGDPDIPFTWFRDRESNFVLDVLRSIGEPFGG